MSPRRRHWWIALPLAVAAHLVAAMALYEPPASSAAATGEAGIEIGLVAAAPSEPAATRETETSKATEPEPEPELEPEQQPEPEPAEPAPSPEPVPTPAPVAPKPPAATPRAAQPPAMNAGQSAGGGTPGAEADYLATLRAWLERHRQYPRQARLRRLEGTALLYFVIDRSGEVLEFRIEESAGSPILDREVKQMLRRARPLPPFPPALDEARLQLRIPVEFRLR